MFNRLASVAVAFVLSGSAAGAQSLTFSSGQNISPAYEGWEQGPDGRYFVFGYMNRNWEEEIDVPVGPDNSFNIGPADQGQPTHFLPRRNRFVFRVRVPAGFTDKEEMIWTLTTKGKTEKAYATLRTDYQIDDVVKASETGALGAGTSSPEVRANKPPVVKVDGPKIRTAKVGEPLTLAAIVSDDGIPRRRGARGAAGENGRTVRNTPAAPATSSNPSTPRRDPATSPPVRITVGKNIGLHLSWFVYRGTGKVFFDPVQIKTWEDTRTGANSPWAPVWTPPDMPPDGRITVQATFPEPGTYVLRALADDGALLGSEDVTVTVDR
jgi:hypothetical protein